MIKLHEKNYIRKFTTGKLRSPFRIFQFSRTKKIINNTKQINNQNSKQPFNIHNEIS